MAKLRLHVEDLRIDSFATDALKGVRPGTVEGHAAENLLGTFVATQCDMSACIASCGVTCKISCGGHTC